MEGRETETSAAIRSEFVALLQSHSDELERLIAARLLNSELGRGLNAAGAAGLRISAGDAVRAVQMMLKEGDRWSTDLPPGVAASIHYMAREGMSLEAVLRGYTAVGTVLIEFIVERLSELPRPEEAMRYLANLRILNDDRMMAAFATEYEAELERLDNAPSRRLTERIEGLLDGGLGDFADLGYRLDGCHIGLVAMGPKAELTCRRLAETLGCELLLLSRPLEIAWAWLGARRQISFAELERAADAGQGRLALAAGEPRRDLEGWRLTHREARAAVTVAFLEPAPLTRYSDVALLAASMDDEAAGRSLLDRYLDPLDRRRDGAGLRSTLRTYLDLDCNAASSAAALQVDRHTVQRRLKKIEESVGESVSARRAEFDVALRLERLTEAIARLGDGDALAHTVPIQLPGRTPLVHPEEGGR